MSLYRGKERETEREREASTHPQEGREAQAVVAHSKVVRFGPDDFDDVLIELGLFPLLGKITNKHLSSLPWTNSHLIYYDLI